jgi:hypothetical protein
MEDFRVDGMPSPSQYAVVKQLASAIDVLSTNEKYPVSVWALHGYMSETCQEAKGEQSATFFSVTIAKALNQMKQTEIVERTANGVRLTEQGRWDLLRKGEMQSKKVVDDSGAGVGAKETKGAMELLSEQRAVFEAETARLQAEIDELRARCVPRQPPSAALLVKNEGKLRALGVNLRAPELLMEMEELKWSMDEFMEKAADFAPTLVLVKMKNGTECGGVAGVPWPEEWAKAADPAKGSFIFSLGATPTRFDLVKPKNALYCTGESFGFGYGSYDLYVASDGRGCGSCDQGDYAGPREKGQLIGGTAEAYLQRYERWELWRL